MKVCMVSKHFPPYAGGLEMRVYELAKWVSGRGFGVLVLTCHEAGTKTRESFGGIEVRRSRVWLNLFNAPFTLGVFADLLRADYDMIDVNLPDPVNSVFALAASLVRGKPLFVTYHADIIREGLLYLPFKLLYGPLQRLVLARARRIFVTSPDYAKSSPSLKGFLDKAFVAPSFVDTAKFNPSVDGSKVRRELGIGGKKIVLFVGRLVEYKGLEYLIDACGGREDLTLSIVGEGPLDGRLKDLVAKGGYGNVIFVGRVSDDALPSYYAACDVFVLPSVTRQEAFGLVLVEAMACGKPVVSTNFSGMPYVVGDAGLLVEPRDVGALRDALGRVLSDGKMASVLGGRGARRAGELFSRDVVCAKITEVYKSAVHKGLK